MKKLLLFVCFACMAQSPYPTYIFTIRVNGNDLKVDSVVLATPTATPTPIPVRSVTIGWFAYPNATNYRVYYGQASKNPTTNITVGNVTRYKLTLPTAEKYYIVAKPLRADGTEITTSNELSTP